MTEKKLNLLDKFHVPEVGRHYYQILNYSLFPISVQRRCESRHKDLLSNITD